MAEPPSFAGAVNATFAVVVLVAAAVPIPGASATVAKPRWLVKTPIRAPLMLRHSLK